jgi:DNA-directed RNA polymerase subunit N (RpoN/RPB10)
MLAETTDEDVKNGLLRINNKYAALLLFWVELYRRKNDNRYDRDELKYTYTLEHIMPQKWEEYWSTVPVIGEDGNVISDFEVAKQCRYRIIYSIGNMTLLKSSLNTSLRNYEFQRKIEGEGRKRGIKHYAELGITKLDIVEPYDKGDHSWDEAKIRERTAEITKDVLGVW